MHSFLLLPFTLVAALPNVLFPHEQFALHSQAPLPQLNTKERPPSAAWLVTWPVSVCDYGDRDMFAGKPELTCAAQRRKVGPYLIENGYEINLCPLGTFPGDSWSMRAADGSARPERQMGYLTFCLWHVYWIRDAGLFVLLRVFSRGGRRIEEQQTGYFAWNCKVIIGEVTQLICSYRNGLFWNGVSELQVEKVEDKACRIGFVYDGFIKLLVGLDAGVCLCNHRRKLQARVKIQIRRRKRWVVAGNAAEKFGRILIKNN